MTSTSNSLNKQLINNVFDLTIKRLILDIKTAFPKVDAIILYGSYGRSEGGWFSENGSFFPYNDFDLLLIIDEKYKVNIDLLKFRKKLAREANIRWIDISFSSIKQLKNIGNSIFSYDLKYGSKVIYGNSNILEFIPNFCSSKISLKEAEILFFTRLWTFAGSINKVTNLQGEESRFFRNQMAKAILAIVDVILLMEKKYHFSYRERYKNLKSLNDENITNELLAISKWALNEKLNPKNITMSKLEVEELYCNVAYLYKKHMLTVFSKIYGKKFNSIQEYKNFYKWNLRVNIKRVLYILIKLSYRFENVRLLNIIQMNILSIILKEGDNDSALIESKKMFKKMGFYVIPSLENIKKTTVLAKENL
jgi:predicted nucleotidyltransferase